MHKDRGAGRCFIWVTYELKRSKAKRNGRIMHLSEEQFVTILFIFLFSGFVVGPSPLCLFVLFCFSLPCAKRRWNHFVLQRVGKNSNSKRFTALPLHDSQEELSYFCCGADEASRGEWKREFARCLAAGGYGEDVRRWNALFFTDSLQYKKTL